MSCVPAVGVHDDFPAGQSAVRSGAALHEPTCRVDEQVVCVDVQLPQVYLGLLQHRADDVLLQRLLQLFDRRIRVVLSGDDDGVNAERPPILAVLHCDLRFPVGEDKG